MDLCIDQLMHRFKIQCSKRVRNYPFLMGQGIWLDSEKLTADDTLEEVLKHARFQWALSVLLSVLKCLLASTMVKVKKQESLAWR